jgi:hypothetical protein
MNVPQHLYLVPRGMNEAVHPVPLYALMVRTGTTTRVFTLHDALQQIPARTIYISASTVGTTD